jgi:hypothetical protein
MTDDTRARFLIGIAAQIPADRVQELHLFGAIRQGGMESGIAVIAVAREPEVSLDVDGGYVPPAAEPRYIVYTARYRHTLKGPDRGKWEMSVTEEADAPLLTVDAVVRGVSRRSGDADETVRLSGDEFRAALPEPARN